MPSLRHAPVPRPPGATLAATTLLAATLLASSMIPAAAEVPSGWNEVARDGFARSAGSTWGRADVGGSYVHSGPTSGTGVAGGVGWVKLGAGQTAVNKLASVSSRDVNISDSFTLAGAPANFDVMHGWRARVQTDGSAYTARVRMDNKNRLTLGVARVNGGTSTWLAGATLPLTYRGGLQVRGELQVTGTSPVVVRARAWRAGDAVPAWQVLHNDQTATRIQSAGAVGTSNFVQSSSGLVAFNVDNLSVGSSGSSGSSGGTAAAPPPPQPALAATSSRGSAPVGSASYPIPSGALFVDPVRGSNTNSGTQSSPLKTVASAASKIPSNGSRTLVLRAGVYHESVKVDANRSMTVQNYPGEAVWFDGSVPVRNWTKSGTRWISTGWRAEFDSSMGADAAFKNWFLDKNRMAANPDQVFLNGAALAQVASAGEVTAGKFHVDYGSDTLTIGSDPSGKEVRASDLQQALFLSGKNSVVQGIGIRRYANPYQVKGALRIINTGGAVRNVVVQDVATFGVTLSGSGKTVDRLTVERAGMMGLGGHQVDNSTVTNSILSNNNTERFRDAPEAGGLKFTASRTVTIKNNEANNNVGASGIWFDVSSHNLTVVNNTANGNTKYGIEIEVSGHGIVANNQAVGGEAGIIIFSSNDFKVFNNEVGGNTLFGIKLAQDERRQAVLGTHPQSRDGRVKGVDPTVTWLNQNIQIVNNVFGLGNRSNSHIYALDGKAGRAVDTWNVTINGNLFNGRKVTGTDATMVAWGKGDRVTLERYETPAALAAAKNSSWRNAQITSFDSLAGMTDDKVSYAATAVPVPTDVASATGRLAAGSRVLGVK